MVLISGMTVGPQTCIVLYCIVQLTHTVFYRQVFGRLQERGDQSLLQEWVMLSLTNFTQRTPFAMATWSLTCFFVCASSNRWLRALYPYLIIIYLTVLSVSRT